MVSGLKISPHVRAKALDMLSVPVRIDAIQWGQLYDQWLYAPSTNFMQWLQENYNIVGYDWDPDEQYRLWFRDSKSALVFRLKH